MALLQESAPSANLPTAPAGIVSLAIWDASALDRCVGKNPVFQRRFLLKFLARASLQVADIVAGVEARNLANVAEIAHVLKSNAKSVGAMQLGEYSQRLEQAGYANDGLTCKALVPDLVEALAKASVAIHENLK